MIKSGFELTGIEPLNAYRSTVMQDFRARLIAEHGGPLSHSTALTKDELNPRQLRDLIVEDCYNILNSTLASTDTLRQALADALAVVDGAEARALLAETELSKLRKATRERAVPRARRGKVGRARVYTQAEIEEVHEQELSRAQSIPTKGRPRGRGRGRGRGKVRGSTGRGRAISPSDSEGFVEGIWSPTESSASGSTSESEISA